MGEMQFRWRKDLVYRRWRKGGRKVEERMGIQKVEVR